MIRARSVSFLLAFLVIGGVTACGDDDDDPTGPTLELFAGTWTTNEFRYTSLADPLVSVELAQAGLGISSLTVQSSGAFTGDLRLNPADPDDVTPISGSFSLVDSNTLEVSFSGVAATLFEDFQADFILQNNILSFTTDDVTFDFSAVNPAWPAGDTDSQLDVTLVRAST